MKTGKLWFDDDPKRPFDEKVERAANRYRQKYGDYPDLVYTNPHTSGVERCELVYIKPSIPIRVRQARSIQPDHFWLGVASD